MLDSVCGCQGGQGLSVEWGPGTPTASSPAPAVYQPQELWSLLSITVVQNTFFPPKCQNSIFFSSALFSEVFELFLQKLPSKFPPEADAQCGEHQSEKPCAAERQRGGIMGLWLDLQPAELGSHGVYRAQGVSEESQHCWHIKPGAAITHRKKKKRGIFITLLLES